MDTEYLLERLPFCGVCELLASIGDKQLKIECSASSIWYVSIVMDNGETFESEGESLASCVTDVLIQVTQHSGIDCEKRLSEVVPLPYPALWQFG